MKKWSIFKKSQAAVLAVVMSISLLSACAGSSEKSAHTGTAESFDMKDSDFPASDAARGLDASGSAEKIGDSEGTGGEIAAEGSDIAGESAELYDKALSEVKTDEKRVSSEDRASESKDSDKPKAEAGLLTAGRWNDNDNWGYFTNLVNKGAIAFPSYGLNPCNRIAVTVKNSEGTPLPNRTVTLEDSGGNTIWESVSDKAGVAYLFYNDEDKPAKINAVKDDGSTESFDATPDTKDSGKNNAGENNSQSSKNSKKNNDNDSENSDDNTGNNSDKKDTSQNNIRPNKVADNAIEITLDSAPSKYKKMDIMFIMDATGSMTDEMTFLQEDFSKITREVGAENIRYSVNFYRDEGDDYVTKCFDFSSDIEEIQKNINKQSADGGGDTPEAVSQILDESINSSSWDKDSVKLAFLIFDAPPHAETSEKIYETVKKSSEMGVHFIPVVSSNAERDTELFGRALAICTNGEYVFLTDDSGIGDSHLEPIIGDYTVESLYDIIINIIKEYNNQ